MSVLNELDKGLSDFIQNTYIVRDGNIAKIIVDTYQGHPISLIGFESDSNKTDFEIFEDGFYYYNQLKIELKK